MVALFGVPALIIFLIADFRESDFVGFVVFYSFSPLLYGGIYYIYRCYQRFCNRNPTESTESTSMLALQALIPAIVASIMGVVMGGIAVLICYHQKPERCEFA